MTEAGSLQAYVTGLSLGLSLIAAIGAQNAFVLRQGLSSAHVPLVVTVCVLLDVALMSAGVGGLSTALTRGAWTLNAVALAGAGFLGWYGLGAAQRAWRGESLLAASNATARSARHVLSQTLAVSLLNPHVYLDTVLLVGTVGAQQPHALRLAFLAGACTASLTWFVSLGFGARLMAPVFARAAAWRVLDALVALVMWTLATTLLVKVL
ncbi:MAG: LysE/ArgO family amino acid transporter [Steroidobacteraceae bacterium]